MDLNFDVEKDLSIDKFQLDKECLTHPSIYYRYLQAAGEADRLVAEKKDLLKVTVARVQIETRNRFADEGKKATEGLISASVDSNAEVVEVSNQLREAQETSIKLNSAIKAFDTKKSSLDNLVKLYCAGYFSAKGSQATQPYDRTEQIANEIRSNLGGRK